MNASPSAPAPPRPAAAPRRPGLRPRTARVLGRIALELAVVFLGVYGAFALQEAQQEREAAERRRQIQAALVREIEDITARTRPVARAMPGVVAALDSAQETGARPALTPLIEPVRVETHMWEATLQSGALDLLDVATVFELSRFYNELNAGFEQLAQLRALSETVLIPNLDRGPDEFYDPVTGRLRPKYQWYPQGIERLGGLAARITRLGDEVVARLGGGPPAAPEPDSGT